MSQNLGDFVADHPIFVDANIFLFHAFDDEKHGQAATSFLARIENEEIEALTSSLVVDAVFFKILVQEAAAHLDKPTIWNIKRAMKDKTFVEKIYKPVLEYKSYVESLSLLGMRIVDVTDAHMLAAADIGAELGLLITDAAHVAVMREQGISHLATADADLFHIEGITTWIP
ncbi:MAG: type II toxin-antitoxin system VapC family toxin [Chloroflexota bacterium]